jgi:hypothetical protein
VSKEIGLFHFSSISKMVNCDFLKSPLYALIYKGEQDKFYTVVRNDRILRAIYSQADRRPRISENTSQ